MASKSFIRKIVCRLPSICPATMKLIYVWVLYDVGRGREREREIEREHLRKMPHAQTHEQKLTEILLLRTFLVYLIVRERTLPVY